MRNRQGQTLTEIMLVVLIGTIVVGCLFYLFARHAPFMVRMRMRQQVMQDSRTCMDFILQRLRSGKATTLRISTPTVGTMVPNSRVDFVLNTPLPSGATAYAIYLNRNQVYTLEYPPGQPLGAKAIASNVTGLNFTGSTIDPAVVSVTLRIDQLWRAGPNDATQSSTSTLILPNQVAHMVESP
jgi:hypothetical protein